MSIISLFGRLPALLLALVLLVAAVAPAVASLVGWTGRPAPVEAQEPPAHDIAGQDARSILRPLYLFVVLAVCVAMTLYAAWQVVFYTLGRLLGVPRPGGAGGDLPIALAGPASLLVVYGAGWLYHRQALAEQARLQPELPRQAGIRRLYTYLVALLALQVFATGAGGLLWTLADLITRAPHAANPATWWREQMSLHASLIAIGLPVWLRFWGPMAQPGPAFEAERGGPELASPAGPAALEERSSLARRLYLYLVLLASVLALLGAVVAVVQQLLSLLLGIVPAPSVVSNLARAAAVAIVAGLVAFYHQRVLRRDVSATAAEPAPALQAPAVSAAGPPGVPAAETAGALGSGLAAHGAPAPDGRPYGVVYRLDGTEQSEWFATAEEARAAHRRLAAGTPRPEWVVVVRLDRE